MDQIAESGVGQVTLSGGEPLTSRDFAHTLHYLSLKGLKTILHTNGLKLDADALKKISKFTTRLSLTFDGSAEKTIMAMRKNRKILKHTLGLIKSANQLNLPVSVKTLITKINKDDVANIGELLQPLKLEYWTLIRFLPINRGAKYIDKFLLSDKEFNDIAKRIKKLFPGMNIKIRKFNGSDHCFISADGKVYTYIKESGDVLIGDIKKEKLKTIISKI